MQHIGKGLASKITADACIARRKKIIQNTQYLLHCRRLQQQREELTRWVEGNLEVEKVIEAMLGDENT